MVSGDNQGGEHDLREKIASAIRSIEQAPKKQITEEELQTLKQAASRLDQMLKAAADADRQTLSDAAARLDRLLLDIRDGKDVSIKRRHRATTE